MEESELCSCWNKHLTYFGYGLSSLTHSASLITSIQDFTEGLIHGRGILYTLLGTKESLHNRLSMGQCPQNSLVLPCLPSCWSRRLDRTVEKPREDVVIVPPRQQYCAGLGQCFPEGCICSESASIYGSVFSKTIIHKSRNQDVGVGVAPLTITPSCRIWSFSCLWINKPGGQLL